MATNDLVADANAPLKRSDPGIAEELKQEAVEDVANVATDAALHVAAGAKNIAKELPKAYRAATQHPVELSRLTIRSIERYVRHNPFEAITLFSALAFALGGAWGLARRRASETGWPARGPTAFNNSKAR